MHQILGLRKFVPKDSKDGKEKDYDAFFEKYWRAPSIPDLFENLDNYLAKIPEHERYNIFYTIAYCSDGKREFKQLNTLAFDVDGIERGRGREYVDITCKELDIKEEHTGIVASGNGVHFLVELADPLRSKMDFKELRPQYKALCLRLNRAYEEAGLNGKADPSIFDARRLLRLPGTINKKPNKEDRRASLIQSKMRPVDFNLVERSGLPRVALTQQITPTQLAKFAANDGDAVMSGCEFLKWCRDNANETSEAQWYAALSITGRLQDDPKDPYKYSHEISKGYAGYTREETESKSEQAIEASGPRTCENISTLSDACKECPNRGKVGSPILLKHPDTIPTENTGFWNQPVSNKGKATPAYDDLRRYFEKQYCYKGLGGSGMVHVWNGTHYEYMEKLFLQEFAQTHFNPAANNNMVGEFSGRVTRTNLKPLSWWQENTRKKINFKNGYLDIGSGEFKPHTEDMGFRYALPYDYDPTAQAPTFEKMLKQVTDGDETLQKVLVEFMGYALSNDTPWMQKALVLIGEGANGKSTFINVLRDLAGTGNYTSLSMDQINKSEYNRQMLDGKLFNVSEETPTKALVDNSLFKSLAAGGEIQVRSPYKEPYFINSTAKLIFSCNELPESPDNTYGYYRRLIIVPFKQTFTKNMEGFDPHIDIKLKKELAGVFNIAMQGYKRIQENQKFSDSKEIEETLKTYQSENDSVLSWYMGNTTLYTNGGYMQHSAPLKELYTNYKFETESQGRRPVSMIKFVRGMAQLVPDWAKRTSVKMVSGRKLKVVQGIKVQDVH